jgi:hypothetical protein
MPNRLIKESICTSEDIAQLSKDAEILFYRLIVNADDYGRYYGNPSIVKSNCFPLKSDNIHSDEVDTWLDELVSAGLIDRYEADGRKYICFRKWDKHQSIRAKKSKFPAPASICKQMISDASETQANESKCPRNPIQSNTNPIRIQSNPDDNDDFDSFWEAYPKKSGDIRQAFFEWEGAVQNGASPDEIIEAVKRQAEEKETRFFPSAEKWLRNRGWTEQSDTGTARTRRVTTFLDIGEAERERRTANDG